MFKRQKKRRQKAQFSKRNQKKENNLDTAQMQISMPNQNGIKNGAENHRKI